MSKSKHLSYIFIIIVLILVAVFASQFKSNQRADPPGQIDPAGTIVEISTMSNPTIRFACDSVSLNYDSREIVLSSPKAIGGWGDMGWTTNVAIRNNALVLKLSKKTTYDIKINGNYQRKM